MAEFGFVNEKLTILNKRLKASILAGDIDGVELALKDGADPNDVYTEPLSQIVSYPKTNTRRKMLNILLKHGADPRRDESILLIAVYFLDEVSLEMLVEHGANVNYGDGQLLVQAFSRKGDSGRNMAKTLEKLGANFQPKIDMLAMHAFSKKSTALARILVENPSIKYLNNPHLVMALKELAGKPMHVYL
jgi:hypothetical protein